MRKAIFSMVVLSFSLCGCGLEMLLANDMGITLHSSYAKASLYVLYYQIEALSQTAHDRLVNNLSLERVGEERQKKSSSIAFRQGSCDEIAAWSECDIVFFIGDEVLARPGIFAHVLEVLGNPCEQVTWNAMSLDSSLKDDGVGRETIDRYNYRTYAMHYVDAMQEKMGCSKAKRQQLNVALAVVYNLKRESGFKVKKYTATDFLMVSYFKTKG